MGQALSRRTFLKSAGAVAAACVLEQSIAGLSLKQAFAEGASSEPVVQKKPVTCKMCMRGGCQLWVTTVNGVPVNVEGDNDYSYNQGTMCVRSKSQILHTYNPYRVQVPMKRTNPKKGMDEDPGWIEISWEEALSEAGEKLRDIIDNDPRELILYLGFAMRDYEEGSYAAALEELLNINNEFHVNGPLCAIHYSTCMILASMPTTDTDMTYCKYLIEMGRSCGPNMATAIGNSRSLVDAQQNNGLRHIVVDPRCSVEASMGEWVPIRPAGDLPFILALLNVMFYEIERYDEPFLKHDTNAPYLVDESTGLYVLAEDGVTPLVWDANTNAAVAQDTEGIDPVLDGEFEVNGVKVSTGFKLMRDGMKDYTPEWAEPYCEVPAADMRTIANDFVDAACIGSTIDINGVTLPYRPVAVIAERGSQNHGNGHIVDLCTKIMDELVGAVDVPGAIQGNIRGAVTMVKGPDGCIVPGFEAALANNETFQYPPQQLDLHEYFPHRHVMSYLVPKVMLDPESYGIDYHPRGVIFAGGNPLVSTANIDESIEAHSNLEFGLNFAYHFDESTQVSDILLPVSSHLEMPMVTTWQGDYETISWDAKSGRTYLTMRDPIDAVYDAKGPEDITIQLLYAMGLRAELNENINGNGPVSFSPITGEYALDPNTEYDFLEMCDRDIRCNYGVTLDELRECGYVMLSDMALEDYYNYRLRPAGSRYQFYIASQLESWNLLKGNLERVGLSGIPGWDVEELAHHYAPVPEFVDIPVYDDDDDFPLFAFNYKMKTSLFRAGAADQSAWIVDFSERNMPDYKRVCINVRKAAELGIQDGDRVVVESPVYKIEGTARVTNLVQENAIGIGGAMGRRTNVVGKRASEGLHYNSLMTGGIPGNFDPVMGATENTTRVKVYKA